MNGDTAAARITDIIAMNLSSVDLNLLAAFNALARERNVTLAANRLGLSQPAMSNALARLRKLFNDPLFVRTVAGMQPTPYAQQLEDPIARACELLEAALQIDAGFDPATTTRKAFTFYLSEIGEIVFLPKILIGLQQRAPGISVKVSRVPEHGPQAAMEAGEVDLAIGIFPGLKAGFYQQRLYGDRFVCIARRGKTSRRSALSLEEYVSAAHAVVASTGTGHDTAVERILWKQRLHRRIAVTVPHFMALPTIVAQTDAIATIPSRMAAALTGLTNIEVLEAPVPFPRMEIRQHWHERFHHDAANRWLRELINSLLRE
ncbi:LysR family transcriptional regulator [Noviherbaspirillum pedocola]|uniref:LysR family transcriptional regulator n=1 Tax=Noviherbaspirillum pedocola TaxID=2801341 RepID=A0A934SUE0_9BURK|nr:LysR family transcriptional regulator [Noviherbaspirillum pedocola]MBK4735438.1 LysR family transcriptional regulator [Noviherbaspirillum pedocola]